MSNYTTPKTRNNFRSRNPIYKLHEYYFAKMTINFFWTNGAGQFAESCSSRNLIISNAKLEYGIMTTEHDGGKPKIFTLRGIKFNGRRHQSCHLNSQRTDFTYQGVDLGAQTLKFNNINF